VDLCPKALFPKVESIAEKDTADKHGTGQAGIVGVAD